MCMESHHKTWKPSMHVCLSHVSWQLLNDSWGGLCLMSDCCGIKLHVQSVISAPGLISVFPFTIPWIISVFHDGAGHVSSLQSVENLTRMTRCDIKHDQTPSCDPNIYSVLHENLSFCACLIFFQHFDALIRKTVVLWMKVRHQPSQIITHHWIKTAQMLYCTAVKLKLSCLIDFK